MDTRARVGDATRAKIASVGWTSLAPSEGWAFLVEAGCEPTILEAEPDVDEEEQDADEPAEDFSTSASELPLPPDMC